MNKTFVGSEGTLYDYSGGYYLAVDKKTGIPRFFHDSLKKTMPLNDLFILKVGSYSEISELYYKKQYENLLNRKQKLQLWFYRKLNNVFTTNRV
jgi:hypothetical protein